MFTKNGIELHAKACEDLTTAIARAKKLCSNKEGKLFFGDRAALPMKRGRPKGSKDIKPRAKKWAKSSQSSECDHFNHACDGEADVEDTSNCTMPLSARTLVADGGLAVSLDNSIPGLESFQDNSFDGTEVKQPVTEFPGCVTTAENFVPECWAFPLP
jgi:hypothetical protein